MVVKTASIAIQTPSRLFLIHRLDTEPLQVDHISSINRKADHGRLNRPPFNNQLSNTSGELLSDLKLTGGTILPERGIDDSGCCN